MTNDECPPSPLSECTVASPEEVAAALTYALRFDERGKPRKGGWDFAAGLAAEALLKHLERSGFVIAQRRPMRPHSAG